MNEEINVDSLIEDIYNSIMEKPRKVLELFNTFFGEDKVDMQGYMTLRRFKSYMDCTATRDYTRYGYDGLPITEVDQETLNSIKNNIFRVISDIAGLKFRDIFILIHFPQVRITNEHDRYVDINHLWAKVKIDWNGSIQGGFQLNRSDYTLDHLRSGYLHSHISSIPTDDFTRFQDPCLGTGPIRDTIASLNRAYNEDIWNLFCLELAKYVTVESISGRPYNYLEKIGTHHMDVGESKYIVYNNCPYFRGIDTEVFSEFTKYFIESKALKFNYVNGSFSIGMPFTDYMTLISNKFIEWYNKKFNAKELTWSFSRLKDTKLLREGILDNGKIYYENSRRNVDRFTDYIGKRVCTFKGTEITITISDITRIENDNKSVFLNTRLALYTLNTILKVLNYRYGRNTAVTQEGGIGTEIRYI